MSFVNIDKKTFWQIMNIGFIGMLVGGLVTVVIADFIETPTPAAIGQLTSPNSIKRGMWFRYDLVPSFAESMQRDDLSNWTTDGGIPYIIMECINVTTSDALDDPSAMDGGDRLAYEWVITPYWQNNVKANELLNGSVENDLWELIYKQIWTGQYPVVSGTPSTRVRPWIDTALGNWSNAKIDDNYEVFKTGIVSALGGITDVDEAYGISVEWVPMNYKYNRVADMQLFYDVDTHLLVMGMITDWYGDKATPRVGKLSAFALTGYSDNVNIAGKTPPLPAPVGIDIDRVFGQPFEYALKIIGPFSTATITVISNDSTALTSIGSSFTTSQSFIPIDINSPVSVTFNITCKLNGLPMPTVNISAILDYVAPLGKAVAVTLSSVNSLGNSFNATWTSNPDAEEYWVMVNGTFLLSTIGTEAIFQVNSGKWNITIVVVDTAANETSVPSNGIIISYTIPVGQTAPTSFAVDTERTDITPPIDPMLFVYFIIIPIVAATIAILLIYLVRIGKIKLTLKQSSKRVGSVSVVRKK